MTLYLKYRPQTIEELDLESVRGRLKSILTNNRELPHAFLFSGPKGTGKTSAARILAKIINCEQLSNSKKKEKLEPCNKCAQCISIAKGQNIDVIELDAASNRGIDDIRSLKESIALSPNSASKKIYIIDEAHMLTTEAANAFLKTLEEPPSHVVFILATTDPQRLPATVLSRLAIIQFQKATKSEIARQLDRVVKGEKLKVEPEVIDLIAQKSDGSFRDAVKLLETLITDSSSITLNIAQERLLQSQLYQLNDLLHSLINKNQSQALSEIDRLINLGADTKTIIDKLIEMLRHLILKENSVELCILVESLLSAKTYLSVTPIQSLPLEIAIIRWCAQTKVIIKDDPIKKKPQNPKLDKNVDEALWTKLLTQTREKNTSIEALLRAAKPISINDHEVVIGVYYRFHKERLESAPNRLVLEEVFDTLLGSPLKVSFTLVERLAKTHPEKEHPLKAIKDPDIIKAAEEIFS